MDEDKLTPEEVQELRAMLQGRRAMQWLMKHSKSTALWLATIVGGFAAFQIIAQWLRNQVEGGG